MPKATSETGSESFVYGAGNYGKFTATEKLYEIEDAESDVLLYENHNEDSYYALNYLDYDKKVLAEIEENFSKLLAGATVAKLDQGNITVLNVTSDPKQYITTVLTIKNNNIYIFALGFGQSKWATQRVPVIKSYLISLGYTEAETNQILADPIFK